MKVQKVFIYFSLIFLILVLKVLAEEVYFPDNTKPQTPLINQLGIEMQPVVIVSSPSFISRPHKFRGKPLPKPPDYLEIVTAFGNTSDKDFYLVKRSNGDWGWMKESEILVSPICLRARNKKNPAYMKVVVKNNWRLNKGIIEEIPFRSGPGDQYPIKGKITIFQIRYAFKSSKDPRYIFVGDKHQWRSEAPGACLKGWIKRDHCILWESQIGVYFDKKNLKREPILIFHEQKHLLDYLNTGNRKKVIAYEDPAVLQDLTPDTTRFPILDNTKKMLRIAFVGDARDLETGESVTREFIDKNRGNINRVKYMTKKVELIFLMDATKSMGPYFEPVATGINNFLDSLSGSQRKRFRFGFAVYRDHDDGDKAFQMICNLGDRDLQSKIIATSKKTFSKDTDYPEAVFEGIYKAVDQTEWTPDVTRAIVVIGDHGNHKPPKTKIGIKDVYGLLKDKRVALYALNVRLRSNTMKHCRQFQNQMNEILDNINQNGITGLIKSNSHNELDQTTQTTTKFLHDSFVFSSKVSEGFQDMSEKGATKEDITRKYGIRVLNYMLDIMKKYNWTEQNIHIAKFNQFCAEGWVLKKSKTNFDQFKSYALISRFKFDMLLGLLARIQNSIINTHQDMGNMIKNACEVATGDRMLTNETLSNYIQRIFYIPYREVSQILQLTPEQLQDKMQNNRFKVNFLKNLGEKYERLHFVQENKTGNLVWDPGNWKFKSKNTESHEWWFITSSGEKYCWLPFEYLP